MVAKDVVATGVVRCRTEVKKETCDLWVRTERIHEAVEKIVDDDDVRMITP